MALRNLLVRVGADLSGLQKGMKQAQNQVNDFKNNVTSSMAKVGATLAAVGIGFGLKSAVEDAMKFEANMQQINRLMAESTEEFMKWADSTGKAMGYSRAEAVKYGATFGNLFTIFSNSAEETSQKVTKFMETQAIISAATGRTMEDVGERLRSGMLGNTESIEDLGVNVQVNAIKMTKAFQDMSNGQSWEQLNEQQKQTIRYFAILEQSAKKYGDTVADNTASRMGSFVASLNNVKLALGLAFLPVLNVVLPILTAFTNKIATVMGYVAQFSQALFGKAGAIKQQTKAYNYQAGAVGGVGDALKKTGKAAKKAGKDAKGSLAGFDEINQLADPTDAGAGAEGADSGAGAGGVDIPSPDTGETEGAITKVSKKIQDFVDKLKEFFKSAATFIKENKVIIISAIAGILAGFATLGIMAKWGAIVEAVAVAISGIGTALAAISWPMVAIAALIALFVANIVYLWQTNEKFRKSVIDIWQQIKNFVTKVMTDMWTILKEVWARYGSDLVKNIQGFMKSIQDTILNLWEKWIKPIMENGLKMLTTLWDKHLKGLIKQVLEFVAKLVNGALEIYNKFISPIANYLIKTLGPVFTSVFGVVMKIIGAALGNIFDFASGLFKALGGVIDFVTGVFTGNWSKAWNGVKDIFGGVFNSLYTLVKTPMNWIIDMINSVIGGLNKISIDIPKWVPNFGGSTFGINIPKIPHLAKGGITNGPTIAMIGDNPGGQEVVSPLDKLQDIIAGAVGTAVTQAMQYGQSSSGAGGDIVLNLDGRTFARIIKPYADMENKRMGANVRLQSI